MNAYEKWHNMYWNLESYKTTKIQESPPAWTQEAYRSRVVSTPSVVLTGYPPPSWPGGGGGTLHGGYPNLPGGYPTWVQPPAGYPPSWSREGGTLPGGVSYLGNPHPDLARGYPARGVPYLAGYPPCPDPAGYPPTPDLDVCPMEFWIILQSIMGYGYPSCVCPMAFWEMLQRIMGYGYPPQCLPHGILGNVAKHYGIWVPPCGQTDWWMEGQTHVKTLPSRRTTYAGGNQWTTTYFLNNRLKLDYFNSKAPINIYFHSWPGCLCYNHHLIHEHIIPAIIQTRLNGLRNMTSMGK